MIIVPVTSNLNFRKHAIRLANSDLESGNLITESVIKVDRILSIKQSLLRKPIGKVKKEVLDKIRNSIAELIK